MAPTILKPGRAAICLDDGRADRTEAEVQHANAGHVREVITVRVEAACLSGLQVAPELQEATLSHR